MSSEALMRIFNSDNEDLIRRVLWLRPDSHPMALSQTSFAESVPSRCEAVLGNSFHNADPCVIALLRGPCGLQIAESAGWLAPLGAVDFHTVTEGNFDRWLSGSAALMTSDGFPFICRQAAQAPCGPLWNFIWNLFVNFVEGAGAQADVPEFIGNLIVKMAAAGINFPTV
jgi:hypothetical protein